MMRLHFTFRDLARVRMADRPYPLIETILALWRLQGAEAGVLFDTWRRHVLAAARAEPPMLPRLTALAPDGGAVPGFLISMDGARDLDEWIHGVRSTPQAQVRGDLAGFAESMGRPWGGWLRDLAESGDARRSLVSSLQAFHETAMAPVAPAMAAAVERERADRARDLLDGGVERLLDSLPQVRWKPPILSAPCPMDLDIHLSGRGLVLVPSYFCWSFTPVIHDPDTDDAPLLVYPVRHRPLAAPVSGVAAARSLAAAADRGSRAHRGRSADRPLAAALGRTRAALLELIAQPASTGELARRLGIAPATVSWHVNALREAGLVATARNRYAMHTLTSQGRDLLEQPGRPEFRASSNLWTSTG
jgi:DNA-binding transcriptional ArsR family regulator